jgi:hypothetical protein
MPNMARASMVQVSMPCSIDVRPGPALARLGAEGHQVQHGAGEPVEPGDLQRIALAHQLRDEIELGREAFAPLAASTWMLSRSTPCHLLTVTRSTRFSADALLRNLRHSTPDARRPVSSAVPQLS